MHRRKQSKDASTKVEVGNTPRIHTPFNITKTVIFFISISIFEFTKEFIVRPTLSLNNPSMLQSISHNAPINALHPVCVYLTLVPHIR